KSEVLFNRKAFPMLCGPASSAGWLWGKVINNRVSPGITDQIPIEQNRYAMACQGCGAVFTFL
uniref:hypothetical protein n=1 Tax=Enterocloster clostridioformis TaxID=1531 RepID=UPI0025A65AE0